MYDLQTIIARNRAPQRPESQEKRVEVYTGTYKRALLVYVAIKRANLPARIFSSSGGKGAVTSVPEAQSIADQFKVPEPSCTCVGEHDGSCAFAKEAPHA